MNWDAIGAAGEVFGAVAVVVSVGYLAIQVRKQIEEARLLATRELASQYQEILNALTSDESLIALWAKGVQDYESLPKLERLRLAVFFQRTCRIMEQQYLHTTRGNLDPAFFTSIDLVHLEFLTFPGVQAWWEGSKEFFEEGFRTHTENLLIKARAKGYDSTFKADSSSST